MLITFHYRSEIWYVILCTITYGLKETSKTLLQNKYKEYETNISYLTSLIKYLSTISMIIIYFIKIKFYGENRNIKKKIIFVSQKKKNEKMIEIRNIIILIICSCIYFSIYIFIIEIITKYKNNFDGIKSFTFLSFAFIYNDLLFFYKEQLNHYIFTFNIFLINVINVSIYSFISNKNIFTGILIFILLFIKYHLSAFALLLFEYLNRNYLLNMYFIIIFEGIPKFISILIIIYMKNIEINFKLFNLLDYGLLFFHFINGVLYTHTKCQIFEKLRAIHHVLVLCLFEMFYPLFHLNFQLFNIIDLIIGLISLFGCLIYCEILILHFCDLDVKTMNYLLTLSQNEMKSVFNEDDVYRINEQSFNSN